MQVDGRAVFAVSKTLAVLLVQLCELQQPAGVQPPLDCSHGLLQPFPKPLSAKASGKRKMSELAGAGAEGDLVSYSYGPRVSNPLTDLDPHLRASLDLARRLQASLWGWNRPRALLWTASQ